MNKTLAEAASWTRRLRHELGNFGDFGPDGTFARAIVPVQIAEGECGIAAPAIRPFVIPPYTATSLVAQILGRGSPVLLGVQNAHWEDAGAWTGEISMPQAKDAGAQMVEIGHSERREFFGETVETTRLKVAAALRHGLRPLLCVGEPGRVRDFGDASQYVLEQARGALDGLTTAELQRVLIAYEPIWAIGATGRPAKIHELVQPFATLGRVYSGRVAGLLYGGSVNLDNAAKILQVPHVTGLFVGRTAWEITGFLELLRVAARSVDEARWQRGHQPACEYIHGTDGTRGIADGYDLS